MSIKIYDSGDLIGMYLDWFNNFLTVPRFAEYYGISESLANTIITQGREVLDDQHYGRKHIKVKVA